MINDFTNCTVYFNDQIAGQAEHVCVNNEQEFMHELGNREPIPMPVREYNISLTGTFDAALIREMMGDMSSDMSSPKIEIEFGNQSMTLTDPLIYQYNIEHSMGQTIGSTIMLKVLPQNLSYLVGENEQSMEEICMLMEELTERVKSQSEADIVR